MQRRRVMTDENGGQVARAGRGYRFHRPRTPAKAVLYLSVLTAILRLARAGFVGITFCRQEQVVEHA